MAKQTAKNTSTGDRVQDNLTTFSIRLNDQQRELVEKAASLRGWTPTNLVRVAVIERAAHIVNTSQPKKTNLKGLAADLAKWMFAPRTVDQAITAAEMSRLDMEMRDDESQVAWLPFQVSPLPVSDVHRFKRACELGGVEFLNLMVEFAESLTADDRTDLEAPVDPAELLSKNK